MDQLPAIGIMEAYIRQAAQARGIDPDVAVRVAKTEGLAPGVWQSKVNLDYGRERSYGPFQLHVAPEGYTPGLGNQFIDKTGLDPSDPSNWKQGVDFALNKAAKTGWGDWFGAKSAGILGKMGIGDKAAEIPVSYKSTFPARPEGILPQLGYPMSGMDQMPPMARPIPPSAANPQVTQPINPLRVGPKPFMTAGPQPGLSAPAASPSTGMGMGGILGLLGGLLSGMGGNQQQAAPAAPPPNIMVPKTTDVSIPKFDYLGGGTGDTTNDELKKLMAAMGMM